MSIRAPRGPLPARAPVLAGVLAGLLAMLTWAAPGSAAVRHIPMLAPANAVIDGPSADILSLDGMSIARDGTGAVVYLKNVAGVAHVFVARLLGGTFQPPQQVDAGLVGASSQPVIAAGQGGLLLVGFVNAGSLYVAAAPAMSAAVGAPAALFAGAINPSLSLTLFGKAYLAFTDDAGTIDEVRSAFYSQGQWSLESAPLNADPTASGGAGAGRPEVAASGDGVGIVVWGENGHIYTRRVTGITPSVVFMQADTPTIGGAPEISASDPVIASGGDSSYASVTFRELVSVGGVQQSRVVMNHLHAGRYDGLFLADGLTGAGAEGADQPATAVGEFGAGWVTSEHDQTHQLWAGLLAANAAGVSVQRVDSSPDGAAPDAVPATAGLSSTFIAWQQTPGIAGPAEIRVRYAPTGHDLGPEEVVSSPALGATDADSGLVAAGDVAGDAAIAWVQGTGAGTEIVAAQLYQPPGSFVPDDATTYVTNPYPVLAWSPSAESWGPEQYSVAFDGQPIGQTTATEVREGAPAANGRHTWSVSATNQAGLTTAAARTATVFVDTVAPRVSFTVSGRRIALASQQISVAAGDPPPPGDPAADASGVALTQVRWGDGAHADGRRPRHAYRRAGTYTITVTVTDRAGNRAVTARTVTIKPHPPATYLHRRGHRR